MADEISLLPAGRDHDPVAARRQRAFGGDARTRGGLRPEHRVLQRPESVKGDDVRQLPFGADGLPDAAGQPVVAVNEIVVRPRPAAEIFEGQREAGEVGVQLRLGELRTGPERQPDQAHVRGQTVRRAACGRVARAGEDIHRMPQPSELAGELADVNTHPARVPRPERPERARVHADHGNAQRGRCHLLHPIQAVPRPTGRRSIRHRTSGTGAPPSRCL